MIFSAVEKAAFKRLTQSMFKLKQCSSNLATEQRCQQIHDKLLTRKAINALKTYNAYRQKQIVNFALARKFRYYHCLQFIFCILKQHFCAAKAKQRLQIKARLQYKQKLLSNCWKLFKQVEECSKT